MSADPVQRMQKIKADIERERDQRSEARARSEAAQARLDQILTQFDCSTIEELETKAAELRADADARIAEVEAALATP